MRLLTSNGVQVYLQWNDQFGASGNDYDLYICRAGLTPTDFNLLNGFCNSSQDTQNGDDDPQEIASSGADEVDVFIKKVSGQGRRLKFYAVAFSFSGVQRSVRVAEHGVMEGGITHHEAVHGVLAVGAVPVDDPGNDDIVDYSDQGPSRIYFPTEETRMKPDVVASTCVSVTGSGGFPKAFCGTSAAAPHVAGIAALLVEAQRRADPAKTKKQVADAVTQLIRDTAIDLGPDGHDNQTGYGRADALAGVDSLGQLSGTGTIFTVNSTGDGADNNPTDGVCDDGTVAGSTNCTLRAAIQEVNRVQTSIIKFAIPGSGTRTIQPASFLPTVTGTVFIDGFSQSGASPANYLVELDGTNVTTSGTSGLRVSGANSWVRGLVINRYSSSGIVLEGSGGGQLIEENRIGTNVAGIGDLGNAAAGVLVSGPEGVTIRNNLISGNDSHGVELSSSSEDAVIAGNIIGADASGTSDLGNTGAGVRVTGADDATLFANVIVGNDSHGIQLTASGPHFDNKYFCSSGVEVEENFIGVNENGTSIPNGGSGVKIDNGSRNNFLESNTIAHNTADGITVAHDASISCLGYSSGNQILQNSIHSNGGLGIDLNDDGVTANDTGDADLGPNGLRNYPVLNAASLSSDAASISFSLHASLNVRDYHTVEFFASDSCDSSGNGEGRERLGSATVETDTSGEHQFVVSTHDGTLEQYVHPSGSQITGTAADFSTSEFSPCIQSAAVPQLTLSKDYLEAVEGASTNTTYTVRLASEPSHDATVDLSIDGDSVVTVSPTPLTFTPGSTGTWQTPQTVTVTAVSDDDPEDEHTIIQHKLTIDGREYVSARVPVRVKDDDVPAVAVTIDGETGLIGSVNLNEGGTATYSVVLTEEPADNVVVDITKWEALQPSPPSLTFTKDNYSTAQDVTLTSINRWSTRDRRLGVHHRVDMGGIDYSVALVLANVEAAGFPGVIFSQRAITLNEGETTTYTIVPAAEPAGNFTVKPESAVPGAVTVSPPSLSFTVGPGGNWETAQEVTVTAVRDDDELDNVVPIVHNFQAFTPCCSSFFRLEDEVKVTVTDGNRAPYFEDGTSTTREVQESAGQDANVGDPVKALDLNASDTLTYTLEDASGKFGINTGTGQITVAAADSLDYESEDEYSVRVTVSDRTTDGLTDGISVKIVVADVNEHPVISGEDSPSFSENANLNNRVARYNASDPEGDSFQWSVDGIDASSFTMDTGGNLRFSTQPDREAKDTYDITILATDDADPPNAGEFPITVTITDVDEPPVITGDSTIDDYDENRTAVVATYTARDPEGDSNIAWSLGGPDRGDFDVTGGVLSFKEVPDHERPADSGGNNHYEVTVQATDSTNKRGDFHVDVIVVNVDEPPVIAGPDTVDDFPENSASSRQVGRYSARDPEGATVTLSLSSGGGPFTLAGNGVLTFRESPDHEQRSSYSVSVRAVAGSHTVDRVVTVNILNVEERGAVTLSAVQPQEGTSLVAELKDDDGPRGTTWQWYRTSSRGSTGTVITSATSPTYLPDADDVGHYLRATASYDDGHSTGKTATEVSANRVQEAPPQPEPPVFPADGDYNRSIRENTRAGSSLGAAVRATDANNDRLTYSIPPSADFEIDVSSGQLRTNAELDHEDQEQHFVTVTATDPGGLTDTVSVTITVEDVDETPVVTGPNTPEVAENGGTSVAAYTATDPDETGIDWVLTGSDSDAFILFGGALTINEAPDYEEKKRYRVTIEAREQGGGTSVGRISVTVNVVNVDEPGMVEVPVSEPRVGQRLSATVSDQDGGVGSIEWKWERRPSGGNWTPIPGATSRSYTPARGDNGHDLRVTAIYRDGHGPGKTETHQFARPVELRPHFDADTATRSIRENTPADRNVGSRFTARHPDNVNLAYSLAGADDIYFDIDESNGQLKTSGTQLDYETLSGHQVEVEIIATDSNGQTATMTVTVTVTDECTSAGEPPCAPGVAAASTTSLRVTWTAPTSDSHDVRYRESGVNANWTEVLGTGASRSHTITGLNTGTTYEVQVRTVNGGIAGDWSPSGAGRPQATVPRTPSAPSVNAESSSSFRVTWSAPSGGPSISSYEVRYSRSGATNWSSPENAGDSSSRSDTIAGLDSNTTYQVQERARNSSGPGAWSPSGSGTTETEPVIRNASRRSGGGGGGGGGGGFVPSLPPAFITGARTPIAVSGSYPAGANVGRPVAAADTTNYGLTYSLGGPDAAFFTIDQATGQIKVAPGTTLDYQARKNTYAVNVTARNIFGATATTRVTITVTSGVLGSLGSKYDANNNEVIELEEVLAAIADYFNDRVSLQAVLMLVKLYFSS